MARCRVLGDFCAAPGLDVRRGWVLEAAPWQVQAWVGIGHVERIGEPEVVPSGYVVSYTGDSITVVSRGEPEPTPAAAPEVQGAAAQAEAAAPELQQEVPAEAAGGSEAGAAGEAEQVAAEDAATEHPEAQGDAVTTRQPAPRTRDPRRARG